MKKVVKLIQLILLVILFGQHVPTTVLAVENDLKDKIHQQVSSLYGFPATIDNSLKEKLPVLLKQFEDKNYLVQSPVKLFNFTDLGIREDAYYPVMIDQRLIALIYYNQETNTYRLETEDVVKEIGRYNPGLANQTPLIFLIINQQVIGSHKNGISNFSNPTKSSEENQSLLSNIDMSLLDTTISRNIYDETSIFYRKSETISPESSPVSSTSQATPFSPPASSNQNSRKLTTDTANDQVVAPEMSQNSSLTPKIWSFFSGAMKLSFNQNYKKSLDIAGDKDYYRIDIPASPVGTAYDWYAFYLNSGFDSYGTLYDSTGKEISKNDDGNGNRDFKISIQLSAGTYYLEVRAYNNTATGSYVLRADKITGSDDNYSFETAVDLPLNSDYKAALDFGHAT
ncbi:MAG: DVUA0089 family protein, partial [Lactococcus sp.]|nr:DVUA0089 family protein [Lactococcus sp.]